MKLKVLTLLFTSVVSFNVQALALSVATRGSVKGDNCSPKVKYIPPESFIDYNPKPTAHPMPWLLPKQVSGHIIKESK